MSLLFVFLPLYLAEVCMPRGFFSSLTLLWFYFWSRKMPFIYTLNPIVFVVVSKSIKYFPVYAFQRRHTIKNPTCSVRRLAGATSRSSTSNDGPRSEPTTCNYMCEWRYGALTTNRLKLIPGSLKSSPGKVTIANCNRKYTAKRYEITR